MDKKGLILGFVKKHKIAVFSTVNEKCKPESAIMEFGETENLELIFDTFYNSRKYKNLQTNKNMAVVIGGEEDVTVQYEGEAKELTPDEVGKYKKYFFAKLPEAQKWEKQEGIAYFKIIPKWIRYLNTNKDPWETFEITF
ncbi:pyridoxamine 5'-phosphate oxidase family protein [Candidatus Microgenomates bacterium]|nr:MAG: pyridoxamine 5'-phosphate oxidase family protein [Candidatus Microgenomates bacterium]